MEFRKMKQAFAENIAAVTANGRPLFEVDINKDILWDIYLNSFPEGTNPLYRKRSTYDCSCCRHFLKTIGGAVYIDDNDVIHSIFEFDTGSTTFQPVMDALATYVKSKTITDVFLIDQRTIGTDISRELLDDGTVITYDHFFIHTPTQSIVKSSDIGTLRGRLRDRRNVFKRSLDEITMDAIDIVLELITSNTLYKGEEWKHAIQTLKGFKVAYMDIPADKKDAYAWRASLAVDDVIGKIRNHSIGVLLVDISLGVDLDDAVRRYERIVAPTNYKRPKAIFTKRMLEDAKKTVSELGYMDSLQRRFATLDDITVNNILFSNRDSAKRIEGDIFDSMMAETKIDPKRFSRVEEISADKFVTDILPTARDIEVFLENKHSQNMVSLIAPMNKDAKSMFKWNNGFSWAYAGNITDSDMKANVKAAGGDVDGDLRFSIQWNDGSDYNPNDFDAHCAEPNGNHIYYVNGGRRHASSGMLDVDIIKPIRNEAAVENITWSDRNKMRSGVYKLYVHCYNNCGGRSGFKAEVEFDGQIYSFEYDKALKQDECVVVATVTKHPDGHFSIQNKLPSNASISSKEVWGLKTNTFVPASVVMYSPNYWDEQQGIGHRHYFFMLKGCVNPECPNGFYNEFLKHELEQHKRVFEALGGKMAVVEADDQLSGLGFSATKRNDLIVKVKGATERIIKIKF